MDRAWSRSRRRIPPGRGGRATLAGLFEAAILDFPCRMTRCFMPVNRYAFARHTLTAALARTCASLSEKSARGRHKLSIGCSLPDPLGLPLLRHRPALEARP